MSGRHVQPGHASSYNQRLRRSLEKGSIAYYSTVCSHLLATTLHIQCFSHTMDSRVVNSLSLLMLTSLRCRRLTYCTVPQAIVIASVRQHCSLSWSCRSYSQDLSKDECHETMLHTEPRLDRSATTRHVCRCLHQSEWPRLSAQPCRPLITERVRSILLFVTYVRCGWPLKGSVSRIWFVSACRVQLDSRDHRGPTCDWFQIISNHI